MDDQNFGTGTENRYRSSKGLFGETDRESGEYHFKSGYTQQVYSNAHFVPINEDTDTPKYYRPYTKTAGDPPASVKKEKKKKSAGLAITLILCFLCALLGGGVGTAATCWYIYRSGDVTTLFTTAERTAAVQPATADAEAFAAEEVPMTSAELYLDGSKSTVSISVETVSYDRFGNQIPKVTSGSGFAISADGYIVTNYHVIETADKGGFNVTVSFSDGNVYVGRIVGCEEDADVALIRVDRDDITPAVFGDSDSLQVGDEIYVIGNPYGILDFSMTVGHVSALNREIPTEETETVTQMFQIDAAVYAGNSGGPVYNEAGNVVGIVTAKYSSEGYEGIGFAIPVNNILPVIEELMDKGYVGGKASLGLSFDDRYNTVYSRFYNLPEGAFVSSVSGGSCCEKAGIKKGDILMSVGSYSITDYSDVPRALKNYSAGELVRLEIFREGNYYYTEVELDEAVPAGYSDTSGFSYASYNRFY